MTIYNDHQFLAKNISCEPDCWNSFLASITINPQQNDPLERLNLRTTNRQPDLKFTFGMMRVSEKPDQFEWKSRPLIPNPNEGERDFRPVVHQFPMYASNEKVAFSKPQSTSFINARWNIRPRLFPNTADNALRVGVLFPANHQDGYVLPNRIVKYDTGTALRPFDGATVAADRRFGSYDALRQDPDLQTCRARLSEVLARVRWFNPDKSPEDPLKPAILVSFIADPDLFFHSLLIGLKRAYDLKLALQRKFPGRQHVVPFVVYNHAASERSSVFSQQIFIRGDENIDNLMRHFFTLYSCPIPTQSNFEFEKRAVILQQGLCQILNRQTPQDPNFDSVLKIEPKTFSRHPFYMETLKSLFAMTNASVIDSYHPFYQHLLNYFRSASIEQNEKNWFLYSVSNDFSRANIEEIMHRLNQRTVPAAYREYCSEHMGIFNILNMHIQAYLNAIHNKNSEFIPDISVLNDLLQQAIQIYCQFGDTKDIMILLNAKLPFNINQINSSDLLHTACVKNDTECVRILCSIPGIDINQVADGSTKSALSFSCYQGFTEIVRILCAVPGIDVNNSRDKIPPLCQACDRGHTEIVHILCARPELNINQINQFDETALMMACDRGHTEIVHILCARPELNINQISKFETTALDVARTRNHTDIVDIIMRAR